MSYMSGHLPSPHAPRTSSFDPPHLTPNTVTASFTAALSSAITNEGASAAAAAESLASQMSSPSGDGSRPSSLAADEFDIFLPPAQRKSLLGIGRARSVASPEGNATEQAREYGGNNPNLPRRYPSHSPKPTNAYPKSFSHASIASSTSSSNEPLDRRGFLEGRNKEKASARRVVSADVAPPATLSAALVAARTSGGLLLLLSLCVCVCVCV